MQAAQASGDQRSGTAQQVVQTQLEQRGEIKLSQEMSVGEIRRQQDRMGEMDARQTKYTSWGKEMSDPWETKGGPISTEEVSGGPTRRHSAPGISPPSKNVHGASKFATVVYSEITNPPAFTPERYEEWKKSLGRWMGINERIQDGRPLATMGVSETHMMKGVPNDYLESTKVRQ